MQKSFTLLEVVFVISLLLIVSSIGFSKLFVNVSDSFLLKSKSQISLIRSSIVHLANDNILNENESIYLDELDNAKVNVENEIIFNNVLQHRVLSTSTSVFEVGKWIKEAKNIYKLVVSKNQFITFYYDNLKGIFDCDYEDELCKDFN